LSELVKQGRLTLEPSKVSASGFKTAAVTHVGEKLQWQTPWTKVPFHPRKFQEDSSEKVSMMLCCGKDPFLVELGEALDSWALSTARANSATLFGKTMSPTEIVKSYSPLLRKEEQRSPLLKAKIWIGGSQQAKVWDAEGTRRTFPTNLKDYEVRASQVLKGMWFHSGRFGLTLETTDLQARSLEEASAQCPFI
jgi:hypothetical protein